MYIKLSKCWVNIKWYEIKHFSIVMCTFQTKTLNPIYITSYYERNVSRATKNQVKRKLMLVNVG